MKISGACWPLREYMVVKARKLSDNNTLFVHFS